MHVLSPTKTTSTTTKSLGNNHLAGGGRRFGAAAVPEPFEEEEEEETVPSTPKSKGPHFGGVQLKSANRTTPMNRFPHHTTTTTTTTDDSEHDTNHDDHIDDCDDDDDDDDDDDASCLSMNSSSKVRPPPPPPSSRKANVASPSVLAPIRGQHNDDHDDHDSPVVQVPSTPVSSSSSKTKKTTLTGSHSATRRRETTSCSPVKKMQSLPRSGSSSTSKATMRPNSCSPPGKSHRSSSSTSSAGLRKTKKGGRKSAKELSFDGYASYSSSEGNVSLNMDDFSEASESQSCCGDVDVVGSSDHGSSCPTKSSNNHKNHSKHSTTVKKPKDTAAVPVVTAAAAPNAQRMQRKKSPGRPSQAAPNGGGGGKKQTVIYTRQAPTIMDLPVFAHTDHEEDMILQALYNKEELFSQLRVGQLKQFVSAFEKIVAPAGDIIILQGDYINQSSERANETSYFYVIHRGIVEFTIDDQHLGTAGVGESFGEFALLYNTPRSITVLALEDVELFRVDALTFRRILSSQTQLCSHKKCRLVESIHFFELLMDECNIADHVMPLSFRPGDVLLGPDESNEKLYIIGEGVVHRKTKSKGRLDTLAIRQGDYFGERGLVGTDISASTYVAATSGLAFTIDRTTFENMVMQKTNPSVAALVTSAIRNDQMIRRLAVLQFMIQYAEPIQIVTLASLLKDKSYSAGEKILVEKESVRAALFYVKQGEVALSTSDSVAKVVPIGGWFGEAHMTKAYSKGKKTTKSMYTVIAKTDCTFSVLTLKDFVSIVAPQYQSTSTICPEPTQSFAVLELIEEVTESCIEPVVVEQACTNDSIKNRTPPSKIPVSPVVTDDMVRGSKHDEKHQSPGKIARQFSDSSSATATSAILNTGMATDSDHVPRKLIATQPATALTTEPTAPAQQRRRPPPKRQRQLSFVRVAPLNVKLNQLQKHSILGEGTFGIVWLVSDPTNQKENKYYALKKQSKAFLIGENQVEAVTQEKIMLENMRHPFLIQLEKTYQDECFIYMLLEFVQGGELFSLMHEDESSILPEHQAKFYALCLSDVLEYLRNRKYVYRDLKGENVMLDAKGYVKLIDFGFCKYLLAEKTYTLCGTPGYLSPEMVTVQGHSFSTDNWSLGVLIYEMIAGSSPFYYDGIDQAELFDAIAQDDFPPLPDTISADAKDLVAGLLQKDPVLRYGSTNQSKIHEHAWFGELDLEAMRHREMEAPWVPYLDGPLDTSNFNDWSELEQAEKDGTIGADGDVSKKGLAVSKRDQKLFEGVF